MRSQRELTLDGLLRGIAGVPDGVPAVELTGISSDSRSLAPGYLFLACQGANRHGIEFLPQAISAGVSAVAWDSDTIQYSPDRLANSGVALVPLAGLAGRLGDIANRWFGAPSDRVKVSGVTGTNGKTTVAFLISRCMQRLDRPSAYIGTLGAGIGNTVSSTGMTTPACIELHRELAEFRAQGAGHVALEVSSHALIQNRIDGVHFDSAIFTNLSRDHIDYHGDMAAYGEAKARLFLEHDVLHRILNVDSEFGRRLAERCGDKAGTKPIVVSTPFERDAGDVADGQFLCVRGIDAGDRGQVVTIESSWGAGTFHLPLVGDFNAANAALAMAQLLCWELPFGDVMQALSEVEAPAGRVQRVEIESDLPLPAVYVDFAHTPAGLDAVLKSLRDHCRGDLWCVFGCGGDRDRGKRPLMGATVARLADRPVVTSDNPRTERPADIIAAIRSGMGEQSVAIPERAAAIAYAIGEAGDDDLVLIAGKGHENFQLIDGKRLPFSDYETAQFNLVARRTKARQAKGGRRS